MQENERRRWSKPGSTQLNFYSKKFQILELTFCTIIKQIFGLFCMACRTKQEKQAMQIIEQGEERLTKALDVRNITRLQRALRNLL